MIKNATCNDNTKKKKYPIFDGLGLETCLQDRILDNNDK